MPGSLNYIIGGLVRYRVITSEATAALSVSVCVQAPVPQCVHSRRSFLSSWLFPQTSSDPSALTATRTQRVYHDYPRPNAHTHSAARSADRWGNHAVHSFHFTLVRSCSYHAPTLFYVNVSCVWLLITPKTKDAYFTFCKVGAYVRFQWKPSG